MKNFAKYTILFALLLAMSGCTSLFDKYGEKAMAELDRFMDKYGDVSQQTDPKPVDETGFPSEIDGPIKWLHHDVSSWPVTANMNAAVSKTTISFPYNKAKAWQAIDGVNANPWVIVKYNGQWYAATYEWLRYGQTSKPVGVLDGSKGDHIKVAPLNKWTPKSGERIGLMVSGLARSSARNAKERSNVVMVTWP